jgi:hypothetical protein
MYKTSDVEKVYTLYNILHEKNPTKEIDITFDYNKKEYFLQVSNKSFKTHPNIPIDVKVKVVYGDSVIGKTPLLLRDPNTKLIYIKTIEEIYNQNQQVNYPEFKIFDECIQSEKTFSHTHFQVWSNNNWTLIKKIIKHKTNKQIFKVITNSGIVEVTEDHSLLDDNLNIIKPIDCDLNTKLLTSYPIYFDTIEQNISQDKALLYGFIFCNKVQFKVNNVLIIYNNNLKLLNVLKKLLEFEYLDIKVVISNKNKLKISNSLQFIDDYSNINNKNIPNIILNSTRQIIEKFLYGYVLANNYEGSFSEFLNTLHHKFFILVEKEQLYLSGLYFLIKKLGYHVYLNTNCFTISNKKLENQISKIEQQNYGEINVFDLETENGVFNAGIGDIIVKNTDSCFLSFKYNNDDFKQNRIDSFNLGKICADKLTNEIFNRPPIELEFEKVFQPFILLTKKRYIGKKFEDTSDPFKLKLIDFKGLAILRRDYCQLVKKCYKKLIDIVMSDSDTKLIECTEIYKETILKIENYNIPTEDVLMTASIGKDYSCKICRIKSDWIIKCKKCGTSNPDKLENCIKCSTLFPCLHTFSLAHINLAQNMLKRREDVVVGDRIPFLFKECLDPKIPKNELAETPNYCTENYIKFNRACYLEQLAKTILPFFKIILIDNNQLLNETIDFTNEKMILFGGKKLKASDYKPIED